MHTMRSLDENARLQAHSIEEITKELEALLGVLRSRKRLFRGAKLRGTHLINAIMLAFLAKPREDQERLMEGMLLDFERLLNDEVDFDSLRGAAALLPDSLTSGGPISPRKKGRNPA